MNPYTFGQDAFQTQADQRFNSFSDPMNHVNMNGAQGPWGINPAYMTPSYMSPYRPAYTGPNPNPGSSSSPGFFSSVNNVVNPFMGGGVNYGGQTYAQNSGFYDSIANKPMDAAMSVGQGFVVPGLFGIASWKYLSKPSEALGRGLGSGLARGMFGTAISNPARLASTMAVGGKVGSLFAGMTLPFAAVQMATDIVDRTVFDPYINQREMTSTLRNNFAGVTFGDGTGNRVTGGGFSRSSAMRQARQLSEMGAMDMTFSQGEISQLTDFSARSGLLDNVNGGQVAERMKSILRQVKTVMAVANTSDFKEAIETISKLQTAGVNPGNMSSTLGALSGYSAIAGTSVSRLMNTVGSTGQMLFQANGLTPYVGQLKAGQALASYEAAYRSGLISPGQLARMGGKEGAAQSAVAGTLAMANSPYMAIMGYNQAFGGNTDGSIVGNMNAFGSSMSRDPLKAMGNFNLVRPDLVSRMLEGNDMETQQNMLLHLAQVTPGAMTKDGKIDAGAAYELLTKTYGLTDDQARAKLGQYQAFQNQTAVNQMKAGLNKASVDGWLKSGDQLGLNRGIFTAPIQAMNAAGRTTLKYSSRIVAKMFGENSASIGDSLENWFTRASSGMTSDRAAVTLDRVGKTKTINNGMFDFKHSDVINRINELSASGDQDAKAFLSASGTARQNILIKMAKEGKIHEDYQSGEEARDLVTTVEARGFTEQDNKLGSAKDALLSAWNKTFRRGGTVGLEADEWMSMTDDAASLLKGNKVGSKEWNALVSSFEKKTGRTGLNTGDIQDYVNQASLTGESLGTYNRGNIWKKLMVDGVKDYEGFRSKLSGKDRAAYLSKVLGREVKSTEQLSESDIALELSKGGNVLERKRDYGDVKYVDPNELREAHEAQVAISKAHEDIDKMHRKGIIDFSTSEQMHASLEMGKASKVMMEAVTMYSNIVKGQSGTNILPVGPRNNSEPAPRTSR